MVGLAEQAEGLDALVGVVGADGVVGLGEKRRQAADHESVPGCLVGVPYVGDLAAQLGEAGGVRGPGRDWRAG
ncbi:hypothetical protein GCM10018952_13400 [Streptosporangium vulgare]